MQINHEKNILPAWELPDHISGSQMNSMLSCGHLYWRQYGLKIKQPPTPSLIKGLVFHKVSELYFTRILEDGYVMDATELKIIIMNELESFYSGDVRFNYRESLLSKEQNKIHSASLILPTVPTFLEVAKDIMPIETEVRQAVNIPGRNKTLVYVMDLLESTETISDWKVSGKKKSQNDADTDLGLTIYCLAYYSRFKKMPKRILMRNMVVWQTPKKKEYKHAYHEIETTRTLDDFNALFNRVYKILDAQKHGIFLPAEVGHWKCSEDWCQNYMQCEFIGRKKIKLEDGSYKYVD